MRRKLVSYILLGVVLIITSAFVVHCTPILIIEFDNQTEQKLTIFMKEDQETEWFEVGDIAPKEKIKMETLLRMYDNYYIEARDAFDKVIYSREFSKEQLKEMGYKLIIRPLNE